MLTPTLFLPVIRQALSLYSVYPLCRGERENTDIPSPPDRRELGSLQLFINDLSLAP